MAQLTALFAESGLTWERLCACDMNEWDAGKIWMTPSRRVGKLFPAPAFEIQPALTVSQATAPRYFSDIGSAAVPPT
jgi:hypothetical protein